MQQAKKFYSQVLELETLDNSMGLLELHIAGGNKTIIYHKPDHVSATFTILNFPVDDIDKEVDALIKKGVLFEQYTGKIKTDSKGICRSANGPHIAWFKDPAGNILSLLQEK